MVNVERVYDRIDELEEFIRNFPDSELVAPFRNELDYLYSLGVVTRE